MKRIYIYLYIFTLYRNVWQKSRKNGKFFIIFLEYFLDFSLSFHERMWQHETITNFTYWCKYSYFLSYFFLLSDNNIWIWILHHFSWTIKYDTNCNFHIFFDFSRNYFVLDWYYTCIFNFCTTWNQTTCNWNCMWLDSNC